MTLHERVWRKVRKTRGCWLWTGAKSGYGYGSIKIAGRTYLAHRVSWELHRGPITKGLCVCHKCDNPTCVRPSHLFLGTQADNMHDMIAKGRDNRPCGDRSGPRLHPESYRGERSSAAKLDNAKVLAIRVLTVDGYSQRALGRYFGVGHTAIGQIVRGDSWSHVTIGGAE